MQNSYFLNISKEKLVEDARKYSTKRDFLTALNGYKSSHSKELKSKMIEFNISINYLWPERNKKENQYDSSSFVLDLKTDIHAYFYGYALADANLRENTRNRGCLSFEIKSSDIDILKELSNKMQWQSSFCFRKRVTNFGPIETCSLKFFDINLRKQLMNYGFPAGKKSDICDVPNCEYDENAFWRGFLDGDGSLGLTAQNKPFVSLVTTSDKIASAYLDFIEKITGEVKHNNRNKRDNAYNIAVFNEMAVIMVNEIYAGKDLSIERKKNKAKEILDWWQNRNKKS